jgi:hypothetical protein
VVTLESRAMILPRLSLFPHKARVTHLEQHMFEVMRERLAQEPFDIFKDEGARSQFTHRTHRLGKHVALVAETTVFAT